MRARFEAGLRVAALGVVAALAAGCQGGDEDALSVVISLPEQQVAGASKATLLVDYSGAGARIVSEGGSPACAFILPGIDGDFTDDRQGTLTIHASGARASRGPADIAACRMKAGDEGATAADLAAKISVRLQAAEDAAGKPIDVTAASAKHASSSAGGGGGAKDEKAVEEAQAAAVAAAASVAASQPATPKAETGATGATGAGMPGAAGHAGSAPGGMAGVGAIAGTQGAPAAPAARPAAPANIARTPVAAPASQQAPVDNSAMPGMDQDPGYDSSPANDDRSPAYSIELTVQTPGRFGALQIDVSHLGNSGGFIGPGDKVECVSLVDAIVAANYTGERTVKIGLISLQGITTPAILMRCGFRSPENVSPGSFSIQVTDASDTDSHQIEPPPSVVVSSVVPRR